MNKMITLIKLFVLLPLFCFPTHYMGGEITWECLPNGQYIFTMKTYRECAGIQYSATKTLVVTGHPNVTTIPMTRISQTDISPVCNSNFLQITCANVTGPNQGGVEEHVYVSNPVTLNGTPPTTGWWFHWGTCCRNPSTNITNANSKQWRLRAAMYPYIPPGATQPLPAHPCFDNSPVFAERPSTVICAGYPFTYNHTAYDPELDSLAYSWATPLKSNLNQPVINWATGYSYSSPLPDTMHHPSNVPATVNPHTGDISFTSYTQGAFQTVLRVQAFKSGILVAEIFREMQITLLSCAANNPPVVPAPFQDSTGIYTLYTNTVNAGALVTFPISATDFEFLPNNLPQTITITAAGQQFGANFTSTTTGCPNPPCAILAPPPPVSGQFSVQSNFTWQTECAHFLLGQQAYPYKPVLYTFYFKVSDDFCPIPGQKHMSVHVYVKLDSLPLPPNIVEVIKDPNDNIMISWQPTVDVSGLFREYKIYYAHNHQGPYHLLTSIPDINQSSYTYTSLYDFNQHSYYFYIKTAFSCDTLSPLFYSASSDTLNMYLTDIEYNRTDDGFLIHQLYPNPSREIITFEFDGSTPPYLEFFVYNIKGELVYFDEINGKSMYTFNHAFLSKGVYTYRFYQPQKQKQAGGRFVIVE